MTYPDAKAQELLEEKLAEEAARIAPALDKNKVGPWIIKAVAEIVISKAMSAGPTRGGEKVQVRFRVGAKTVASSHLLSALRDDGLEWLPKSQMVTVLTPVVFGTVVRSDDIESSLREELQDDLLSFLLNRPELTSPLAGTQYRNRAGFQPETRKAAYEAVLSMKIRFRLTQAKGVVERVNELSDRAADLVVAVPYALFPDAGRKLGHVTARRSLLKAMTKAMNAGLSDADIDSVKNEALVSHIMS